MLSSIPSAEPRVDPLVPLEQLMQWLLGTAVDVLLGLAVGLVAARLMRSRHVHWSWAAVAFALALLIHPAFATSISTLGVAILSTAMWGRSWHREDVDTGSDLAQIASERRAPSDVLGSLVRKLSLRRRELLGASGSSSDGELILGQDQSSRPVSIPFGGRRGGTHTLVVGATGSGKTVTQTWMAVRAIEHGMGVVVVDPKGDRGMHGEIRRAAHATGRRFIEWTPNGGCVYNPYARGSETEIADKALAGERFTEPHYLRQAQRYLGHVVRSLRRAELEVSLQGIVDHMDPARLEHLVRSLPEAEAESTHAYLDSLTGRQQSDLAGIRDRLAILSESDVGPWLNPQTPDADRFDLLEAVRARAVVYFSLESDRRPLLTQMLGAAIVQDMQTTVAALQGTADAHAGGHRRVLCGRCGAGGPAVRTRAVGRRQAASEHARALRSASAGAGEAARAGHGQPVRARRPPSGGPRIGRADRKPCRNQGRLENLAV